MADINEILRRNPREEGEDSDNEESDKWLVNNAILVEENKKLQQQMALMIKENKKLKGSSIESLTLDDNHEKVIYLEHAGLPRIKPIQLVKSNYNNKVVIDEVNMNGLTSSPTFI